VAQSKSAAAFDRLVEIMHTLRAPDGCPWDREQDARSLRPYVLEEAYEVVQAIDDEDAEGLAGELGDLLLQIVFHSQLAEEKGEFDIEAVVTGICEKLIRRHPHVFGDDTADTPREVRKRWEMLKLEERGGGSVVDDMPKALPALATAEKLGRRAAQVGFDWREVSDVLEKVREETRELELDLREKGPDARRDMHVEEELGDLLFSVSNLARHLGMSPEVALRRANEKFERRFRAIEPNIVADGSMQIEQMDELWEEVKRGEEAARSESEEVKRSE
jgi:ATP diphosphatase